MAHLLLGEPINNRILFAMRAEARERIMPALELIEMRPGQVINHVDGPIVYLYFVNRGLVSLIKTMNDGRAVEVGAVGIEGVTNPDALFGIDKAVIETVVQIPGTAFRVRCDVFKQAMDDDSTVRDIIEKYIRFTFTQLAQTAACNRLHSIEQRCCCRLLRCCDNALADDFPLTQEFLAMTLGVQRSGVSITANFLQKAGLIRYVRGHVTVLDRAGLEDASCECYAATRNELDKLFPPRNE